MIYHIMQHKLSPRYDPFIVGYYINKKLYIYCLHLINKNAVFHGTAEEVLKQLNNRRFLPNATKRKAPENGELITDETRMRIRWNKRCRARYLAGQSE